MAAHETTSTSDSHERGRLAKNVGTGAGAIRTGARSAIHVTTMTIGVIFGIGGFEHGLFEFLQGNKPTNGPFIQAIGEGQRFWPLGTEDAFTLVPNFLVTGLLAMIVGATAILWSLAFLRKRHGTTVFLVLFVLLFLVGGGIGQVAFFLPAWAFSTRIGKPLRWWGRALPRRTWPALSRAWLPTLVAASLIMFAGLEAAVFGWVPGLSEPGRIQDLALLLVLAAAVLYLLTYVSAIGRELGGGSGGISS